jgi:hypothetical protein
MAVEPLKAGAAARTPPHLQVKSSDCDLEKMHRSHILDAEQSRAFHEFMVTNDLQLLSAVFRSSWRVTFCGECVGSWTCKGA